MAVKGLPEADEVGFGWTRRETEEAHLRMQCIEVAKTLTNNPSQNAKDVLDKAEEIAKWVISGQRK